MSTNLLSISIVDVMGHFCDKCEYKPKPKWVPKYTSDQKPEAASDNNTDNLASKKQDKRKSKMRSPTRQKKCEPSTSKSKGGVH